MRREQIVVFLALMLLGANVWENASTEEPGASDGVSESKYLEAPVLAALVASGDLPPVDERLPVEPKVRRPLHEVGTYGGTLTVFTTDPNPWQVLGGNPEGRPYPIRMNFDGSLEPDMALGWELADDYTSFTLFLREGQKWSNGDPFTAEDFVFYYDAVVERELSFTWGASSNVATITAVDDYTVHWEYNEPFPRVLNEMITYEGTDRSLYAPTALLKRWHIEYNPEAQALAEEEGFETWQEAFESHSEFCCSTEELNPPTMQPFMIVDSTNTVRRWERNPYYFAVDPAGQQLPYIDAIVMQDVDVETYKSKVIGGEADFSDNMSLADCTQLVENQESGDYKINLIESWFEGGDLGFMFNLNHPDPAKRDLFNNVEFRRALSLALDRGAITEAQFMDLAVAPQTTATDLAGAYLRYDPEEARHMLDAIGLDQRNADGVRLSSEGKPLVLNIAYGVWEGTPQVGYELTKEYWEDVGIGVNLRAVRWQMIYQNRLDGTLIAPYPLVYRSNLINVPDRIAPLVGGSVSLNQYGDQFFFKEQ